VTDYRAFFVEANGRFSGSRAFVCATDQDAIVWAKQLSGFSGDLCVELWSGKRMIKRIDPPEYRVAISHEVHDGRMVPKANK
jgi:hypothetical protein